MRCIIGSPSWLSVLKSQSGIAVLGWGALHYARLSSIYITMMHMAMAKITERRIIVTIRLPPPVKAKAVKLAAEEHRTLTAYIEHLIEQDAKRKS